MRRPYDAHSVFLGQWLLFLLVTILPATGYALDASEVLVVANRESAASLELARYYMNRRRIPSANFLTVSLPTTETCAREVYETNLARPVRQFFDGVHPRWRIRCIALMYGIPIRIAAPAVPTVETEAAGLLALGAELKNLEVQKQAADHDPEISAEIDNRIRDITLYLQVFKTFDAVASVDSELSLVLAPDYPLAGWVPNPFYPGNRYAPSLVEKSEVLMVSRLDGPNAATAKRLVDDALATEATGLEGKAYFDAKGPFPEETRLSGYRYYDRSVHLAAQKVKASGRMPVVLETTPKLFPEGACPAAALYCGWYSLGRYVNAFDWQRGAVGFHMASQECASLKAPGSKVWCKRMLEEGVAATIGPVGEPYIQGFPPPELFFAALSDGVLTLAECYLLSLPYLSWKMILIGDPLYRPFAKR